MKVVDFLVITAIRKELQKLGNEKNKYLCFPLEGP